MSGEFSGVKPCPCCRGIAHLVQKCQWYRILYAMTQRVTVKIIWRTAYLFTLHLSVSRCWDVPLYTRVIPTLPDTKTTTATSPCKHLRRKKLFHDNKTGPYKMGDESSTLFKFFRLSKVYSNSHQQICTIHNKLTHLNTAKSILVFIKSSHHHKFSNCRLH